ncbi:MAG: 3-dehydroquinate synthase II, partial [Methanobrevibacter sp.]|nr:3-dehydroquinate synthase II [Methanobrevibacter sp.]
MTPDLPWDDRKEMITTALESGISYVLDLEYSEKIRKLGNVNIISNEDDADIYLVGIDGEGDGSIDLSENLSDSIDLANAKKAKSEGKSVCAYIRITDKLHEQLAVKLGPIVDYIILIGTDWTVIPLENIIADLQ